MVTFPGVIVTIHIQSAILFICLTVFYNGQGRGGGRIPSLYLMLITKFIIYSGSLKMDQIKMALY